MTTTLDRVRRVLVDHLGVTPEQVTETASLVDDLGADSLDAIEIAMCLEEEFGIEFPDELIQPKTTTADIVRLVASTEKEEPK